MMWAVSKPTDHYRGGCCRRHPGGGPSLIILTLELDILHSIRGEVRQVYAQSASPIPSLVSVAARSTTERNASALVSPSSRRSLK